jgi:pyruvate ferredoxin oxidoreductase alpha subunit
MSALPRGRTVMTANEAAAYGVVLSRVQAIGCYPITPQTLIVEKLADLVAGRRDVEYANLESEHSMLGWTVAASRAGVRTFTATSSQGLLYAHEQLHRASRERVPLVMVNINRSIFAPWSLEPDLSDSLSQRDTGWVQLYCSSGQEVLDSVICAYRIAETVMLPVMVCSEGFLLSHTSEVVDVPAQEEVDAFLPPFEPPEDWVIDPGVPRSYSGLPEPRQYAEFQQHVAEALDVARPLVDAVAAEFGQSFGRPKTGLLQVTGNASASSALVTMATMGDTALELLDDDDDLLVVRVHAYRPFPGEQLQRVLSGIPHVCVIDRAAAFGAFGPLGSDVRALRLPDADEITNVVCGVGGTEVTPDTLRWALAEAGTEVEPVVVPEGV